MGIGSDPIPVTAADSGGNVQPERPPVTPVALAGTYQHISAMGSDPMANLRGNFLICRYRSTGSARTPTLLKMWEFELERRDGGWRDILSGE